VYVQPADALVQAPTARSERAAIRASRTGRMGLGTPFVSQGAAWAADVMPRIYRGDRLDVVFGRGVPVTTSTIGPVATDGAGP
jgi:hypothetical protein